jgi:DNA repair protein RecO (recombination protein O)
MATVLAQPAYILHTRLYRDTSLLVELFTPEYGRISAIARNARGLKSRFKGLLQPFIPLVISWYGKTELMTLSTAELAGITHFLKGGILACGFYLNELLIRLLHRYDAHPYLYELYHQTLIALPKNEKPEAVLRIFEKQLLSELGYALALNCESENGKSIMPDQFYHFDPIQGFSLYPAYSEKQNLPYVFAGASLLALHAHSLHKDRYLKDAKRLLRLALGRLLGDKPIKSRELFL